MNSRVKLENLALEKEIKQPHEKTTQLLVELLLTNYTFTRKELIIIAKCLDLKKSHELSTNSLINVFRVFLVRKELQDLR